MYEFAHIESLILIKTSSVYVASLNVLRSSNFTRAMWNSPTYQLQRVRGELRGETFFHSANNPAQMFVAGQTERFLEDGIEFLFADVIPQDYDVTARDGGTSPGGKNRSTVS